MQEFFNSNHPFFKFFAKIFWAMIFNLIFILSCIPVVTVGAAFCGMNRVFLELTRERQSEGWYVTYFKGFVSHFKSATILWFLELLVMVIWVLNIRYFYLVGGGFGIFCLIVSIIAAIVCFSFFHGMYAVMVHHDLEFKDGFSLTIAYLKTFPVQLIGAGVWFLGLAAITFGSTIFALPLGWMVIMVFGLGMMASCYCYNEMFVMDQEDTIDDEENRYSEEEIRKYADMSAFLRDKEDE